MYKIEYNGDGTIEKLKARLVAKEFTQKEVVDFPKTYSSVIEDDSIRSIFVIVVAIKMQFAHFKIGIAFLNGDLLEVIYMKQR